MRRLIGFDCEGETLAGSLDEADGATGLLIVSGGNELRMGAHRGMAELAQAVAAAGHPVFRFDARGIGDSTGENRGYRHRLPDILAAKEVFREEAPGLRRIVAMGNCDAATTLMLHQRELGFDGLILTNLWLVDDEDAEDNLPAAAAIRARYFDRLRDPRQWLRLLRGGVNIFSVAKGLRKIARATSSTETPLFASICAEMSAATCSVSILLAEQDNTAIAFTDAWSRAPASARDRATLQRCATGSHSFAHAADKAWLRERVLKILGG